ncbi:hypothetical protein [Crystallibacter crystallopoietes]|uniref:hypothetical protein n=1 Tax=Crystallibacter crystallopoietes TaxID=37928 RepID=UPI0012377A27|nr:hypothetical protein [Arthrobacter crystallopoietes]
MNETSTLPLSIAELDSTVYVESSPTAVPPVEEETRTFGPDGLTEGQQKALAAVTVRAGEVEAAEWTLDQAKAACNAQIAAALASGVPAETVAEAAGVCAAVVADLAREAAAALSAEPSAALPSAAG